MPLVDTGLIVRYYIDEAASGQGPTAVLDGSGVGADFDLAITYAAALNYTGEDDRNGFIRRSRYVKWGCKTAPLNRARAKSEAQFLANNLGRFRKIQERKAEQ